jgi:glucose-1-phosphate adenylyltransferase
MGSYSSVSEGVILPYCNIGRGVAQTGDRRFRRTHPGKSGRGKTRNWTQALAPHENGVCLITKAMMDHYLAGQ